eukprot:768250-Amphidinium_carterae.1
MGQHSEHSAFTGDMSPHGDAKIAADGNANKRPAIRRYRFARNRNSNVTNIGRQSISVELYLEKSSASSHACSLAECNVPAITRHGAIRVAYAVLLQALKFGSHTQSHLALTHTQCSAKRLVCVCVCGHAHPTERGRMLAHAYSMAQSFC